MGTAIPADPRWYDLASRRLGWICFWLRSPWDRCLWLATWPTGRGRSQSRWVWTAAVIGPLAIPLLYLADAVAAVRKAAGAAKPN
jgi:hypothetical protein